MRLSSEPETVEGGGGLSAEPASGADGPPLQGTQAPVGSSAGHQRPSQSSAEEPSSADGLASAEQTPSPSPEGGAAAAGAEEADRSVVVEQLVGFRAQLQAIEAKVSEVARLGDRREALIDRLHEENQRLRVGELAQAQSPVIRELIRTYDLVVTLAAEESPGRRELELVLRRLLDGLEQFGVRLLDVAADTSFDSALHVGVASAPTPGRDLDMTVERTVRVGFVQDGERVLRPADVEVRRYQTSAPGESSHSGERPPHLDEEKA